jgi:hypothetical protein
VKPDEDTDLQSLAAQLAPSANRVLQRQAIVRPVSRILLRLGGADKASVFKGARNTVLKWMNLRSGRSLPDAAWSGDSFDLEELGSQRTEAVALEIKGIRYWAARLDDADKSVAQRSWVTEIALEETADAIMFGVRLECVTRGEDSEFDRSIPGFVRKIVESEAAFLDARKIGAQPRTVATDKDVAVLVRLLVDPNRRSDVIVFSLPEGSTNPMETAASALEVHRRTLGAAHVAILTSPASFHLTGYVGKEFSVYRQAVRNFRPGFDPSKDQPLSHPIGLPDRIKAWPNGGASAYARFLVSQALAHSVAARDTDGVPSFSFSKRAAAEIRMKAARQAGSSEHDLLELADEEIKKLKSDFQLEQETYVGLLTQAERERDDAAEAAAEAKARWSAMRRRVETLEQQLEQTGRRAPSVPIPNDLENFQGWCETHLVGRVEVLNRAYRGVKSCQFTNKGLIYQALLLLRDQYVPMRLHGGRRKKAAFESDCRTLGLEESPALSKHRFGEEGDMYFVQYDGKSRRLDRHLRNGGNTRDPRFCFALYFFWDEDSEQVVVGWLPSHLDNRMT